RNDPDLGFLRSCNKASKSARGEYLYFLNNDTTVLDHWLSSLVYTLEENAEIGLAGSMMFYPDGTLQEAGGVIWNDGSAANLGRNEEFITPLYAAMRDVDYVSGAGLLIRRSLWERIGGFDERFVPVYCEDSDLALSVRQHGFRSIVQPASKIVHFEGRTNGTDIGTGLKAYQVANSEKLKSKWAFTLERHHKPRNLSDHPMRRFHRPRLLLIDHKIPKPKEDAGSLTAVWVMRILSRMGYDITFLSQDLRPDPENEKDLSALGVEVLRWPDVTNIDEYLENHAGKFDAFLLYRPMSGGNYAAKLRELNPDAPQIYFTVDIHFLRNERAKATGSSFVEDDSTIAQLRQTELNLIASCDASIILSRQEIKVLGELGLGARLHHLPLILENASSPPPRDNREDICFVGGYQHPPNVDAVTWFVTEVWPIVRERLPDLKFYIVGSLAPQSVRDLEGDGVVFTGFVEDLNSFLDQRVATVATLTYGAGIKGKIGSSFAAGVPCICNSVAAEGMELTDGKEVMIADAPEAIADAIEKVCTDHGLWQSLSLNGQTFVEENYSPDVTARSILDALARVGAPPFFGTCPITGAPERRLFDGSLDSLSAGPSSTSCSDRVLLAALARQLGQSTPTLTEWKIDSGAATPTVVTYETGAVLDSVLTSLELVEDAQHPEILLAKLDCDKDFDSVWRKFLPLQSETNIKYIAVAIYASSEVMPHTRPKSSFVADLVDQLSTEGFEVRSDRNFLPECAITGTICVEARRPLDEK
ncbi:MAG: glycosyltransferase, partial [Pseudomonadota bacterium]